MLKSFAACWQNCAPATRWAVLAALLFPVNAWAALLLACAAAWLSPVAHAGGVRLSLAWLLLPVAAGLLALAQGQLLPPDDLLRHATAWRIGYDYRTQYPWSDIPATNLWIGFDALLGGLHRLGIPELNLVQWLPGIALGLAAGVLIAVLGTGLPRHRQQPVLSLLLGCLGLLLLAPRTALGRPEVFLALFAATAWCCRRPVQVLAWTTGFLLLVPAYWLGWIYAPFALVMRGLRLPTRIGLASALGGAHLLFWQIYSGDYLGLLHWLAGTLQVPATENRPLLTGLGQWPSAVFFVLCALGIAITLRNGGQRLRTVLPLGLLTAWLLVPDQVRYEGTLALALLPWLLRKATALLRVRRQTIPAMGAVVALGFTALHLTPVSDAPPRFALPASARVYSEQPYATVFFGAPGIAVEPSFALGATFPAWRDLGKGLRLDCVRLRAGGFTHVLEKSLSQPERCLQLTDVQGPWRLWRVTQENNQ